VSAKKFEWDKGDLTEERLEKFADESASRAVTRIKKGKVVKKRAGQKPKVTRQIVIHRERGSRNYLGMAQYGDCGFHTFYAVGEGKIRCCAESSCDFDIDRHRGAPLVAV